MTRKADKAPEEKTGREQILDGLVEVLKSPNQFRSHGAVAAQLTAAETILEFSEDGAEAHQQRRAAAIDFMRAIAQGEHGGDLTSRVRASKTLLERGLA